MQRYRVTDGRTTRQRDASDRLFLAAEAYRYSAPLIIRITADSLMLHRFIVCVAEPMRGTLLHFADRLVSVLAAARYMYTVDANRNFCSCITAFNNLVMLHDAFYILAMFQ